jgi:hypothetical protein
MAKRGREGDRCLKCRRSLRRRAARSTKSAASASIDLIPESWIDLS